VKWLLNVPILGVSLALANENRIINHSLSVSFRKVLRFGVSLCAIHGQSVWHDFPYFLESEFWYSTSLSRSVNFSKTVRNYLKYPWKNGHNFMNISKVSQFLPLRPIWINIRWLYSELELMRRLLNLPILGVSLAWFESSWKFNDQYLPAIIDHQDSDIQIGVIMHKYGGSLETK
jgi:hypothetical protein